MEDIVTLDWSEYIINVNSKKWNHLRFYYNNVLITDTFKEFQATVTQPTTVPKNICLQLNVQKTKIMTNIEDQRNVMVNGRTLETGK